MSKQFSLSILLLLAGLIFSNSLSAQSILLNYFNIRADGADVLLEWELPNEKDVIEYQLFRKFNNEPGYEHVATITAVGDESYQYLDDDIFKTNNRVLHYELQVITSGKTHRFESSLSFNPTSIQRTWGNIKSMFR